MHIPKEIYIDSKAECEAMRPVFEADGYVVHYAPGDDYLPGAALITCTDDGIGMEIADWGTKSVRGHTQGAAYYVLGWLDGYECGYKDADW